MRGSGQSLGKNCLGIARGVIKLVLLKAVDPVKIGFFEMRSGELGSFQMRSVEGSSFEMRFVEGSFFKMRSGEVSSFETRFVEDGSFEMGFVEGGSFEMRSVEVGPFEMRFVEASSFEMGFVEASSFEMRSGEVGPFEMHSVEGSFFKTCPFEVGSFEMRLSEVGLPQVGKPEIQMPLLRLFALAVSGIAALDYGQNRCNVSWWAMTGALVNIYSRERRNFAFPASTFPDKSGQCLHDRPIVRFALPRDALQRVNTAEANLKLVVSKLLDRFGEALGDAPL
jgi:hypothetical protein